MNEKILSSLGLAPRELRIYKAVLKMGVAAPAKLAKAAGIKRTTGYSIARGLVEKGLLVEDATKRPRVFLPSSPKEVQEIVLTERKRLEVREKLFKQLAAELSRTEADKTYPIPQIHFVEAEKMEHFLNKEASKWNKSLLETEPTWWGFQDHTYAEVFPNVIASYWKQAQKDITLKLLSNQSDIESKIRSRYPRREIKFWNKSGNFLSSIWIAGEYIITINTRRHPFYLVELHDAILAHDLREVFKSLWQLT